MASKLCYRCFKEKGEQYEICQYCGYIEGADQGHACYLVPGTMLRDRYIVGEVIGSGGFGITYVGYDTTLGMKVAIKELFPARLVNRGVGETKVGVCSGEKQAEYNIYLNRFLREAKNLAMFSKEKDIVNVYAYFEENDTAYIIMEYVEGVLLKDYLKEKGTLTPGEATDLIVPILEGLDKIHRKKIIHKDISPDNIFLLEDGRVKIFDFGAASFLSEAESEAVAPPIIKMGYASPEQYTQEQMPGPYMDIYSVGAIFYEMVTGEKPDEGSDRYVSDELVKPSKRGIRIDKKLEKIMMKALAVRMEDRFQTAAEFSDAITKGQDVSFSERRSEGPGKKTLFISAAACAAALVLFIVSLLTAGGRSAGSLSVKGISADTLTVWLRVTDEAAGQQAAKRLEEDFEKYCPQISLEVTAVLAEEYDEKIAAAGSLPDVFATDGLDAGRYCISVENIYETINLAQYPNWKASAKDVYPYEIPTGVDILIAYENEEKFAAADKPTDEKMTRELYAAMDADICRVQGGYDEFGDAKKKQAVLFGGISDFGKVSAVTLKATPSTEIAAIPVRDDTGNLQAVYTGFYGVNKEASGNRQKAGLLCLSYLLSQNMQEELYLKSDLGIPLQAGAQEQYQRVRTNAYVKLSEELLENVNVSLTDKTVREWYAR